MEKDLSLLMLHSDFKACSHNNQSWSLTSFILTATMHNCFECDLHDVQLYHCVCLYA